MGHPAGICQSLRASHERAKRMRACGYVPHAMEHALEKSQKCHEEFEKAIDTLKKSTEVYHVQKAAQRTASQKLADSVNKGRDATEKLDDMIGPSL